MSTPESFINNDPLTAESWPTIDEFSPLDPLTTEIPVTAENSPRRSVPKPPDVDEILLGHYTGWVPVIKAGESLASAEERALERIRRIEAQLDAEDYGIPVPPELASPMATSSRSTETYKRKQKQSAKSNEESSAPSYVARITDTGQIVMDDDYDEVLSPAAALEQARRRIQQMRNDLETNVEMVARSFEHPMFNPKNLPDSQVKDGKETDEAIDELQELLDTHAASVNETDKKVTVAESSVGGGSASGDELIVIHTNVDEDADGPMTAPVDTTAVRKALDDVAEDVFIITNKTGPALSNDELLLALQKVAKRIEDTSTLVDVASRLIDQEVRTVSLPDDVDAPSGNLFTHKPVSQDVPDDAPALADLLAQAAVDRGEVDARLLESSSVSPKSEDTDVAVDAKASEQFDAKPTATSQVRTTQGKGKKPPVKKSAIKKSEAPQPTETSQPDVKSVASDGNRTQGNAEVPSADVSSADIPSADVPNVQVQSSSVSDDAQASGDNEELFLSDLLSALDQMVETATDVTKSTALDDVLAKYSHILETPTGSIPVVVADSPATNAAMDINAMIAQIKNDARALLDDDVLDSLRVDHSLHDAVEPPAENAENDSNDQNSNDQNENETSDDTDESTKPVPQATPLIDALLQQLSKDSQPINTSSAPETENTNLDSANLDSASHIQDDVIAEVPASQEPPIENLVTERERTAAEKAQKVIQDIVDRLEADAPTPPLGMGIDDALKSIDLPKIFKKEPPAAAAPKITEVPQESAPDVAAQDKPEPVVESGAIPTLDSESVSAAQAQAADSDKAQAARTEFATSFPSATYVVSDQLPKDNSLELVIMRDEIRDLRDRLDSSQRLIEDLMIRLANLTEIALQSRQN